ncbi:YchJ family protein [Varunaivibrio sulfuroxidans]|uniref:SEC-C motif-containing protein n=1 Tax=Varunaivibrio sulfuroxidans TaxID=1773489 RepID=A0A4R3JBJ3_9PROT|nr:YchJ family protein [Varunaivibrio sulfuroxidans]TCS62456.1 SEC-C motif-containing protein [Varunaivibrio sulfuroxidans]WES30868.1 YchJ family protein [Varunaivibrio sulfuroxidans]
MTTTKCPCGSGILMRDCCGAILDGRTKAETAEAMMRARYTAHVVGDFDFVANTHAAEVKKTYNKSAAQAQAETMQWVGLEIMETVEGGAGDDEGVVTFGARFMQDGVLNMHRERSNFRRENGVWVYVDGKINPQIEPRRIEKVGRNAPCPCGSGKKYKKCCGA